MAEGPAGVNRPFVKTFLKYTVKTHIPDDIWTNPPLATDVLNIRVNAPQADVIEIVQRNIGKVIFAVNGLAHPSKFQVVHEDTTHPDRASVVPSDHVGVNWTYVLEGSGVGEFSDTSTTSKNIHDLHEVLIQGNDEPIERAQAIREFDSGPIDITRIEIHTE